MSNNVLDTSNGAGAPGTINSVSWTQVLIGHLGLRKHKLLPEDSVPNHLNKIDDHHAAPQPSETK